MVLLGPKLHINVLKEPKNLGVKTQFTWILLTLGHLQLRTINHLEKDMEKMSCQGVKL